METIDIILIVLALLAFLAATIGITSKVNLQALGLALLTLSLLV